MPATTLSLHYAPRYSVPLLLEPWKLALAGLPCLPLPLLTLCVSVQPVYTLSVLLLDTAPAVPTAAWGIIVAAGLGVVSWLMLRTINAFDSSVKDAKDANQKTEAAVHALTALVTEMRMERRDDRQLTNYLKERQDALEKENKSLLGSVQAFDKYLAVLEAKKNGQA